MLLLNNKYCNPLHNRQRCYPWLLALMLLNGSFACGFADKEKRNLRKDHPAPPRTPVTEAVETQEVATKPKAGTPKAGGAGIPSGSSYDESVSRATSANYYQKNTALRDLFFGDVSLLCFPAALAYQLNYQKNFRQPAYSELRPLADNANAKRISPSQEIRYLTEFCDIDTKVGTYPSQAARCITKFYETSGYEADISIFGSLIAGEHFADNVSLYDRAISIADIRRHLKADRAVIAMLGYYKPGVGDGKWQRLNGHFVALTGYDYRYTWADKQLVLHVANPDIDYARRDQSEHFDRVKVSLLEAPNAESFSDGAALVFKGEGFNQHTVVPLLERLIVFKIK